MFGATSTWTIKISPLGNYLSFTVALASRTTAFIVFFLIVCQYAHKGVIICLLVIGKRYIPTPPSLDFPLKKITGNSCHIPLKE